MQSTVNYRSAAGHQGSHLPDNFNECVKGFKTSKDEGGNSLSTQMEIVNTLSLTNSLGAKAPVAGKNIKKDALWKPLLR